MLITCYAQNIQFIRKVLYKKPIECIAHTTYTQAQCIMRDSEYGNENAYTAEHGSTFTAKCALRDLFNSWGIW